MDIQITNPHILWALEERGFKIETGDEDTNELVQELLFELGFEWSDGKKLKHRNAETLVFSCDGLGFSKHPAYFAGSKRLLYTIRAIRGLVFGSKLVTLNNIKDATHTRQHNNSRFYLVTHKATYYWSHPLLEWRETIMSPDEFAGRLEAISDNFVFDAPEHNDSSHKPKTYFDGVW